ncbi:HIT domain-containing protein [Brachybacterium muris]|uniref:HIT domain-containing protein n=1 Tax=Brachybacterium muris TaxID=219301 RepID=UPI0021A8E97C|nr:HIT domain-containing protein [Brachybacterium muris]MCT1999452.1 HIT domain-containing protein [Brachybacterium muris]
MSLPTGSTGYYDGQDFYCDVAIPRRQPIEVVHEDEDVLAFRHTRPFWPVHIVVVPKRHVESLLTLEDQALAAKLLAVVQQVAADVVAREGKAGVLTNLGEYQDSKHLHIHVHAGSPLDRSS